MKFFHFVAFILMFHQCIMMRVDWDNNGKTVRTFTYEHEHDGNLTKAEIEKNPDSSDAKGMYRIKTLEEINGPQPNNCVSKTAKCLSNCNINYDLNSSIFALKVAIVQAKRASCYDECYNEITPGCNYPLKRIQY